MESTNNDETVELTSVQGEIEAKIISSLLESEGIRTLVRGENVQDVLPLTVDGLGEVKIYVLKEDLVNARIILKEYRGS